MVESIFVCFRTRPPSVAIVCIGYGVNFSDVIATNEKSAMLRPVVLYVSGMINDRYMSLEVQNITGNPLCCHF